MRRGAVVLGALVTSLSVRCGDSEPPVEGCGGASPGSSRGRCAGAAGQPGGAGGDDASGGDATGNAGGAGEAATGGGGSAGGAGEPSRAAGVRLEKVALYQAVESVLVQRGTERATPSVGVVAQRAA